MLRSRSRRLRQVFPRELAFHLVRVSDPSDVDPRPARELGSSLGDAHRGPATSGDFPPLLRGEMGPGSSGTTPPPCLSVSTS